jgi:hypothetical protein
MNSPPKNRPQRPPQNALAPKFDPITNIVEADDLFVGMVSLAHNAEVPQIEAGLGHPFDGSFRRIVIREDGDDCVHFFHLIILFVWWLSQVLMLGQRQSENLDTALLHL